MTDWLDLAATIVRDHAAKLMGESEPRSESSLTASSDSEPLFVQSAPSGFPVAVLRLVKEETT